MHAFRRQLVCLGLLACAMSRGVCAVQKSVEDWVNEGVASARAGRFAQAETAYRHALAIDPHCVPAEINLGLAYFKSGQYAQAIPPLKQAESLGVETDQIHTLLGMSFYALRQYREAGAHYEVLFARQPGNIMLQYFLAESYMRSHQAQRLTPLLEKMQSATPDSPVIYMLAGEQYDRLDQTDKAIAEFLKVEAVAPDMPMVHFALGYFYWERHLNDRAKAEFASEIQVKGGETSEAKGYLGDIALHAGEDATANELLRESVEEDPQVRIAQFDLGILDEKKHDDAAAIRHFRAAIALDPDRPDAYYRMAVIYRGQGNQEGQRAMLAKVQQLHEAERTPLADAMAAPAK